MTEVVARVEVLERQMDQALAWRDAVADLGVRVTALERTVHDGFSAIHEELRELRAGHQELRADVEALRRHMLVLHEDLVERIKVLGEGRSRRRRH